MDTGRKRKELHQPANQQNDKNRLDVKIWQEVDGVRPREGKKYFCGCVFVNHCV